ncbi:MAG TPA: hypothetical protein VEG38_18585 [Acidimicrobiia bacterium]|nr:hypothetical protein [Acidimicrobiia bacterium]
MGLFDTIREKAAELLGGVTEKASGLAGDLPGAEMLEGLSQSATDAAGQATDAAGQATDEAVGAVQDLGASASDAGADAAGAVTDATDTVTGPFTDTPGERPQP